VHKRLGRDTAMTPADHRAIPDRMASCPAIKAGGRRRKGQYLE